MGHVALLWWLLIGCFASRAPVAELPSQENQDENQGLRFELLSVEPVSRTMGSEREKLWELKIKQLRKRGCPEFVDVVLKWATSNSLTPKVTGDDEERTIKVGTQDPKGLILVYIDWSSRYHGTSPPSRDGYIVRFGVDFISRNKLDERQMSGFYASYHIAELFDMIHDAAKECGWYSRRER